MTTVKITQTDEGLLVEQVGHGKKGENETPVQEKNTEENEG